MGASDPLLQLVCAVLVLTVPLALLVLFPPPSPRRMLAPACAGVIGALVSVLVDRAFGASVDAAAQVLDAALAGAIAASVAVLAALRLGTVGGAVFAAVWSTIVFQPVVAATIGTVPSLVQTVFGAIDYAGVLATHVASAAALIVLQVLPGPKRSPGAVPEPVLLRRALGATLLLTIGAAAWMVGVERVITIATGRTLVNAVVGLLLGAIVWVVIERIAGRPFVPSGLVGGATLGWAAVGLGVAFLSPMALAAATVIGVAGGAAVVVRAREGADLVRRGAIAGIVTTAIGGVIFALLADAFGLAATGSTTLVVGQLGAVIAVSLGSAVAGVPCWALAVGTRMAFGRRPSP